MKKLLVSDYDLTLKLLYGLNNDFLIKANVKAIKRIMEQGHIFMINTGRNYDSIKEEINANNIPYNYLSCNDGSLLLNHNDELICYYDLNSNYDYKLLFNILYSKGYHPYIKLDKVLIENKDIENISKTYYLDYIINEEVVSISPMSLNKALTVFINKYPNYLLKEWCEFDILIGYGVLPKDSLSIEVLKKDRSGMIEDIRLLSKLYDTGITTVMNKIAYIRRYGINKTTMIEEVRKRENIDKDNVYTIGDSHNDYEMIRDYNGYTLPWAKRKLKDVSAGVVPSVRSLVKKIEKK